MGSRMDKYKNKETIPSRSDKNKELYKQIYNAYDEFENLVVPSNAREITMSDLKKEIVSRKEYQDSKEDNNIINRVNIKDKVLVDDSNEVYDINELLNKALNIQKEEEPTETKLSNKDYLKKIKVDNYKTNIEEVKEMYDDIQKTSEEEDESLIKTANLSLEILSDLKSDNDATMVGAPIKNEELPKNSHEADFYSSKYKFSRKDFEEEDGYDEEETVEKEHKDRPFLKIMLIVFGICLVAILLIYIINYFNKV